MHVKKITGYFSIAALSLAFLYKEHEAIVDVRREESERFSRLVQECQGLPASDYEACVSDARDPGLLHYMESYGRNLLDITDWRLEN